MTAEYKHAIDAHNTAIRAFRAAETAYRARAIGDDGYIAARRAYDKATALFDAAYEAEAAIVVEDPAPVDAEPQPTLL